MKKLILLALLFINGFLFAQDQTKLNLIIMDPDKVPEVNAGINIFTDDKSFTISGTTDSEGKYSEKVPAGIPLNIIVEQYDTTFNFKQALPKEYHEVDFQLTIQLTFEESFELPIHFASASADVREEDQKEINKLLNKLESDADMKIEIGAHTDDIGTTSYNQQLSLKRAQSVRSYLIGHGINKDRIKAKGYGENKPIADNATEQGRAENRRVEISVIQKGTR